MDPDINETFISKIDTKHSKSESMEGEMTEQELLVP